MENAEAGVKRRKKATKPAVKVLLADDSAENLRVFRAILEGHGYEVSTAANGEEALQKLRKDPANLIVSDILMPVMDGFLFLKQCKADVKLKGIRFVFLTATYMDRKDEELALKLGADAFIRKPVEPDELINKLTEVLASEPAPRKRGRRPKAEKADQGNLYNLSLTQKLEKKMLDLEAEITGRRKIEEELRHSEERYRLLFETMAQGIICIDEDARIISANQAVARISGLPVDQLIGMTTSDPRLKAIHEDGTDYAVDALPMLVALRTGKPIMDMVMGIFNYADETYHWVSSSAVPMFRPGEDRPYQVYSTFDDITDRHLAYKALQESESRITAILENTGDAIWSVDTEFRLIAANGAARRLYNMVNSAALMEGVDMRSAMPKENADLWTEAGQQVFKGEHVAFEKHHETPSGPIDLEFSLSPIVSPSGRITGASNFARDITVRKKVEQQLKESEERYRLLVENASEAIYVIQDDKVKFSRSGISAITGYSGEEMRSKPFSEMIHPDDLKPLIENHVRRMRGEKVPSEYIYRAIHKNGDIRWVEAHVTAIEWEGRLAMLMLQSDITERRRMEESIKNTGRLFKMLFLCNEAMVRATNETELFRNVCNVMTEIGGYSIAWAGYAQDDENKTVKPVAMSGADIGRLEQAGISWADGGHGGGLSGRAIRTGKTVVVQDIALDPAFQPWSADVEKAGIASTIALPLKYRDVVFGSLNIYAAQKNAFREDDISLLGELAEDLAYGITALREHRQREEAETALKKSEELFRKAVQSTTDIVWDWDIGSGHLEWYGDIDRMLGYPAGEFPRTLEAWENALHPDDHNRVMAALNRHTETGEIYNVEYRVLRRDGTLRNWIDRSLVIRDEGGRIVRSVGACVDITEHRQSEARARIRRDLAWKLAGRIDMESALRHCLDAAIDISGFDTGVIYVLDEKSGDFKAACHHGGSAFLLEHYSVLKADSVDVCLIKKGLPLYVKAEEFTPPFDEQLRPEGFTFDATIPVLYQDKAIASLGILSHTQDNMPAVIRDSLEAITADIGVIIDRISFRQALQASEERYRFITDHTTDIIWMLNKYLHYTFISPSVTRLRGFTVEEAMERDVTQQITPASLYVMGKALEAEIMPQLSEPDRRGTSFSRELEMYRKDGSTVWMETSMIVITDEKGEFNGLLGISRDISARRQAEQSLRESEEKYRLVVENAREAIIVAQDGLIKFANRNTAGMVGYSEDEISLMPFINLIHADDRQMVIDRHLRRLKGEVFEDVYPFRVVRKDGQVGWVEIQPVKIEWEGRPATLNFLTEITERKLAVEALKQSEEKYRLLVESANETVMVAQDGLIKFINAKGAEMTGYTIEELTGKSFAGVTHPDDLPLVVERHQRRLKGEVIPGMSNYRVVRKDGQVIRVELSAVTIEWEGKPATLNFVNDITGRVKAEKDIAQRAALLDSAYDSIIAYDLDGKIVYANQTSCSIRGFSRDEMLAMNMRQLVPVEELPGLEERHRQLLEQGELSSEAVHIRKDGSTFIADTHLRMADLAGDKLVIAVQRDITLRKQMENQLVESEQRYRSLFQHNPAMVYAIDRQARFTSINATAARISGYSEEEAVRMDFADVIAPEYLETVKRNYSIALNGEPQSYEAVMIAKDGRMINIHITSTPIIINGNVIGIYGIAEDITGRKKAEEELRTALEMLGSSLESTIDAIAMMSELRDPYTAGHQRRVTHLALAIAAELGLTDDQMQPLRVAGLLHDVGKIYVPSEILSKPGRLTDLEMGLARAHATAGYDVVAAIKFPWPIADIVVQHHERMDGSGYPASLKGDEIALEARILAVADVTEAMMSHRPYRPSLGMDKALAEITGNRGRLYDEKAVDACVTLLTEKGFKFPA